MKVCRRLSHGYKETAEGRCLEAIPAVIHKKAWGRSARSHPIFPGSRGEVDPGALSPGEVSSRYY